MSAENLSSDCGSLRRLPPEVRLMIYKELLVFPTPDEIWRIPTITIDEEPDNSPGFITRIYRASESFGLYPQILSTCKKIAEEATELLYCENLFRLESINPKHLFLSSNSSQKAFNISLSQMSRIRSLHLSVEASYLWCGATTVLSLFPKLCNVRAKSNWLNTVVAKAFPIGEKLQDNIQILSQAQQIKTFTCEFQVKSGLSYTSYGGSAYRNWQPHALETTTSGAIVSGRQENFAFDDPDHPRNGTVPPSFSFHRWWMRKIQKYFQKHGILVGVPTAWRFQTKPRTSTSGPGYYYHTCVEMTIDEQRDHIPCEIWAWYPPNSRGSRREMLWQGSEDQNPTWIPEE
ncbi:hypothetical protein BT63DRAFT_457315 [Microthyrium microscopicum]|uniref:F-box domain-containing protein n=1 Tax=Microthyrium microscopicum TaxID=703497 RepID=A0A6A6UAS7_9PEZI|nr:hypothetical protein BT63DRAFT_457315 [Microthyrium microscopicum]